uniref:Uncharacterized protein n=1 Tax=Amphiprion percula TaxID=161767 RepID=A0A3P8TH97_AMPPE
MCVGRFCLNALNKARIDRKPWVSDVYKCLRAGYVKAATFLFKNLPLNNKVILSMSALAPSFISQDNTLDAFKTLGQALPNVVEPEKLGQLLEEVQTYQIDLDLIEKAHHIEVENARIDVDWWSPILSKKMPNGEVKFPTMGKLVKALLSVFSGPLVEGSFNLMDDIVETDRARLHIETYEALAIIKSHIKASGKKSPSIDISAAMRRMCLSSYTKYKEHLKQRREKVIKQKELKLKQAVKVLQAIRLKKVNKASNSSPVTVPARASTSSVPARASTSSVPASASTSSVPARSPTSSVPARAPTSSVPARAPTSSVPARASTSSVPARASTSSVPARAPTSSVPARASTTSVPARAPTSSVPARAPTSSVPARAPTSSVPARASTTSSTVPATASTSTAEVKNSTNVPCVSGKTQKRTSGIAKLETFEQEGAATDTPSATRPTQAARGTRTHPPPKPQPRPPQPPPPHAARKPDTGAERPTEGAATSPSQGRPPPGAGQRKSEPGPDASPEGRNGQCGGARRCQQGGTPGERSTPRAPTPRNAP